MVLTELQREICRLLADIRLASGESYLAGGATLNELLGAPRISRDIDIFHDTDEALEQSWESDRALLEGSGYFVEVVRERPSFLEAEVGRGAERVLMQWARDSAYRFFPLVADDQMGLVLHPFDLATNKVLALVGRLEVRDWVDVIESSRRVQHLGYLAWSACGKDPGFSPLGILEHAARSSRYSQEEVGALAFAGDPPDSAALAREWRQVLSEARDLLALLPGNELGTCVVTVEGELMRADAVALENALARGVVRFHRGSIRGALPRLVR